jgi:hypothetical protein
MSRIWWFVGDIRLAFTYMENWPITTRSEAEFSQDIVVRFKVGERSDAAVLNPCYPYSRTMEKK